MGSREDRFAATMGQAVPAFEVVVGSPDRAIPCQVLDRVSLHPTAQPVLENGEAELARFVVSIHGAVSIGEDGSAAGPDASGAQALIKTGESAGVVVFTDRRLVAALAIGDFVGMRLDHDRDQRAVMTSLDYSALDSMELVSRKKLLGGRRPVGFQLAVMTPAMAALQIEPIGETNLELQSTKGSDLNAWFHRLVKAVCDHRLPKSDGAAADRLRRTRDGTYEKNEDGDPVAIFDMGEFGE